MQVLLRLSAGIEWSGGVVAEYDKEQAGYLFPALPGENERGAEQNGGKARFSIPDDLAGPYPVEAQLVEPQAEGASLELAAASLQVQETGLTRLTAAGGEATGLGGRVEGHRACGSGARCGGA